MPSLKKNLRKFYPTTNDARFKNTLAGCQSAIVIIAIIVGGVWTWIVFEKLNEAEKAAADLRNLQLSVAEIELLVSPAVIAVENHQLVHMSARVTNTGRRETALDFKQHAPLHVARVTFDADGGLQFAKLTEEQVYTFSTQFDAVLTLPSASLLPGEHSVYPFLVEVPGPGFYFAQFSVPVSTKSNGDPWHWAARSYFLVQDSEVTAFPASALEPAQIVRPPSQTPASHSAEPD